MLSLASLQEYLYFKASQHHEMRVSLPFTIFFHPTDESPDPNYALPVLGDNQDWLEGLIRLRSSFAEIKRKPSLQFIAEVFPGLDVALCEACWSMAKKSHLMIFMPETDLSAPQIPDLEIATLSSESSIEAILEGLDINARGFDPRAEATTLQEAIQFRQGLTHSCAFTAYLRKQPVAAGMFTDIHQGLTELVGITTLQPFRRQGIAAALTAFMTQQALRYGATHVFLIAESQLAGRVYERVGFRPSGTYVTYELSA